ncbi:MAG: BON domain-containing protein [Thermoguttaceae bacterium]|nr:BON domain-containing protein [Thermoguttaceae bacterium]
MPRVLLPLWLAILMLCGLGELKAQRLNRPSPIGDMTRGSSSMSLGGSSSTLDTGGVGVLQGNERFIRRRGSSSFVGGLQPGRFIGSRQGTGMAARPSLPSVRIESAPAANRPLPPVAQRRTGMYDPPLEIGFDYHGPQRQDASEVVAQRLQASPALHPANRIEVFLAGTTATLRGEVVSERDRGLAEQLALFEPGIYSVRNELRVRSRPAEAEGWRASPTQAGSARPQRQRSMDSDSAVR